MTKDAMAYEIALTTFPRSADDRKACHQRLMTKSLKQVQEAFGRYVAVLNTTDAECAAHCQVDGLPGM